MEEQRKKRCTRSQKSQAPALGLLRMGDVTSGHRGLCLLSWKMGIVNLAVPVLLQGACGSQMRSRAGKCPADSKVWSNYEGLRLLLLSTHSNYAGSGGNKHTYTHPALDPGTDRASTLTCWQGPLYQKMTAIWRDKGWGLAGPPL